MTDEKNAKRCAKALQALGEPTRMRIIDVLLEGPSSVGEISSAVKMPLVNVSHHLGVLRDAGLVESEKKGRFMIYSLSQSFKKNAVDLGWCKLTITG